MKGALTMTGSSSIAIGYTMFVAVNRLYQVIARECISVSKLYLFSKLWLIF